jgi:hypothetical protein
MGLYDHLILQEFTVGRSSVVFSNILSEREGSNPLESTLNLTGRHAK